MSLGTKRVALASYFDAAWILADANATTRYVTFGVPLSAAWRSAMELPRERFHCYQGEKHPRERQPATIIRAHRRRISQIERYANAHARQLLTKAHG
jgi:hypothetical protein